MLRRAMGGWACILVSAAVSGLVALDRVIKLASGAYCSLRAPKVIEDKIDYGIRLSNGWLLRVRRGRIFPADRSGVSNAGASGCVWSGLCRSKSARQRRLDHPRAPASRRWRRLRRVRGSRLRPQPSIDPLRPNLGIKMNYGCTSVIFIIITLRGR